MESGFNPGTGSTTSNPPFGTYNQACTMKEGGAELQNSFALPLTVVSRSFYAKRGKLCNKNLKKVKNNIM